MRVWIGLLGLLLTSLARAEGDPKRGQSLYNANCLACHGASGAGDGPASRALRPPPRSFQDPAFWEGRTDAQLATAIRGGRPGTAMMAFGQLSEAEMADLVAFLRTKAPGPR